MSYILEKNDQHLVTIDLYSKLMTQRILFLNQEFRTNFISDLQAQILYLASISKEDIKIYINSPGGNIYDMLGLYDTIQFVKNQGIIVSTICTGMAASAASIILLSGSKGHRKALPNSTIMLHESSNITYGSYSDAKISMKEWDRLQSLMNMIISNHTNYSYQEVADNINRDVWFDVTEAIEKGIIDAKI